MPHNTPVSSIRTAFHAKGYRSALVIISFTPVRSLGDCVGSAYALRYEGIASHVFRAWLVSPPHTCSLNRDFPDTVGFTPHICKQNRDAPCLRAAAGSGGLLVDGARRIEGASDSNNQGKEDPRKQALLGTGELAIGYGGGLSGAILVAQLARTENAQTPNPAVSELTGNNKITAADDKIQPAK